jgi:antitoxin component YwqK of YwqJK toxin-antitoxin module
MTNICLPTLLSFFLLLSINGCAQTEKQLQAKEPAMIPMTETYQRAADGIGSRYYQDGSSSPFTGVLYGRYDNGELMTTQDYVDGIGNGKWTSYDPDGRKNEEGTYVENRVEGPVTLFYEDGSVKARGQYKHWKQPIGKWIYYDRQGNVVHEMTYTP